jgi:hypothetical protein
MEEWRRLNIYAPINKYVMKIEYGECWRLKGKRGEDEAASHLGVGRVARN